MLLSRAIVRRTSRHAHNLVKKHNNNDATIGRQVNAWTTTWSSSPLDGEMIAANDRTVGFSARSYYSTTSSSSSSSLLATARSDVEMLAANFRRHSSNSSNSSSDEEMKDEYGAMDDAGHSFVVTDFVLENGHVLPEAQLRYQTYGTLNEARDNVLVVCHALTGNASLHAWWGDLLGPGLAFDTSRYLVVCCNILGSCYGSTNPTTIDPTTQRPYGKDFPDISVRDTARLQLLLLQQQLQIRSVKAVIGGSFGGMQVLEFAVQAGSTKTSSDDESDYLDQGFYRNDDNNNITPFVRSVVPIACGVQHSAWQIGISEVQRQAIYKDPYWETDEPHKATAGLEIARQMGMISYRTAVGYDTKFGRARRAGTPYGRHAEWQVRSYLEYQGVKFLDRFDPVTYVKLTEQMDSHDLARNRGSLADVLGRVQIPALVMGIDSDVLYPLPEQELVAQLLPQSDFRVIRSDDGHDGFLLEQDQVGSHITEFLERLE